MSPGAKEVFERALDLSEADRADVAGALLESLEPAEDAAVEAAWRAEVGARVAARERGEIETVPWSEVRDRLLLSLRERRSA